MGLDQQLADFKAEILRTAPAGRPALYEAKIEELRAGFALEAAVGVEARAPDFRLPDVRGNPVSLTDLLGRGPVVLTFFLGDWCPYCNIQLRAYQAVLPQIAALGARLVAIWSQLPVQSLATAQTDELTFDVLSDVGNHAARRFGLVYTITDMAVYLWIVPWRRQKQNLDDFVNLRRWFDGIEARPGTRRAHAKGEPFSTQPTVTEEGKKLLFGQTAVSVAGTWCI